MAQLKVKNVGPIRKGLQTNDGFLDFHGITMFTGSQGTGKSTVAKLFSTLSWIEKALVRGDFTDRYVEQYNRFRKHLGYQNLSNYLRDNSYIEYRGEAFQMVYEKGQLKVTATKSTSVYSFPKIMYVPAERNFASAVDRPDLVKRLPLPLYTFMDEYEEAKLRIDTEAKLPVGDASFEYRKSNRKSFLKGLDYSIELLEASSGFQSLVPLILVTRHLSEVIKNVADTTRKERSREEEEKIRKMVLQLLDNKNISEDVIRVTLESISSKFKYERFINVVEEPEQNLYPESQKAILFELFKYRNENPKNKLVITTHSPYLINYLTLAVKAKSVSNFKGNESHDRAINQIVPMDSQVDEKDFIIYELQEKNGTIEVLDKLKGGLPSDENQLNNILGNTNESFAKLLEIQNSK